MKPSWIFAADTRTCERQFQFHQMEVRVASSSLETIVPMREAYRAEMNCQITHDSIPRRAGWCAIYELSVTGATAGYGVVAIAGPWKDKPTILEFFLLPEFRVMAFKCFEALMKESQSHQVEIQSNAILLSTMLPVYGRNIISESILFQDRASTALPSGGARLARVSSQEADLRAVEAREGASEWLLKVNDTVVGKGGIAFHYNRPYGDLYMDVVESSRRQGLGSYFVQELKAKARELGAVPAARCRTGNRASQATLQKAGFVPYGNILIASLV